MTKPMWPYATPFQASLSRVVDGHVPTSSVLRVTRCGSRYIASRTDHGSALAHTWSGSDPIEMMIQLLREYRWPERTTFECLLEVRRGGTQTLLWAAHGDRWSDTDLAIMRGWLMGVGRR